MYAILEIGGKQYKVAAKDVIDVENLNFKPQDKITLDKVLFVSDGKKAEVGQPYLLAVSVEAEVISNLKAKKVVSFKYRRRKNSRWMKGHRQHLSRILIKKINKANPKA